MSSKAFGGTCCETDEMNGMTMDEEKRLWQRIDRRFVKGVVEYGLIADGDRILVGLSGGKDSMALLELLARRSRIYKPRFSVVAVHVVMTNIPYQSDVDYLRAFAQEALRRFHEQRKQGDFRLSVEASNPVSYTTKGTPNSWAKARR